MTDRSVIIKGLSGDPAAVTSGAGAAFAAARQTLLRL